jgi:hypothetical protein
MIKMSALLVDSVPEVPHVSQRTQAAVMNLLDSMLTTGQPRWR